jgi:hypothetical protein
VTSTSHDGYLGGVNAHKGYGGGTGEHEAAILKLGRLSPAHRPSVKCKAYAEIGVIRAPDSR